MFSPLMVICCAGSCVGTAPIGSATILFRHVSWTEQWWWWGRQHEPGPLDNTTSLTSLKKNKKKKKSACKMWVTDRMNNWWCQQRLVKSRKLIRYTGPLHLNKLGRGQSLCSWESFAYHVAGGSWVFPLGFSHHRRWCPNTQQPGVKESTRSRVEDKYKIAFVPSFRFVCAASSPRWIQKQKHFSNATGSLVRLQQCHSSDAHSVCLQFSGSYFTLLISVFIFLYLLTKKNSDW